MGRISEIHRRFFRSDVLMLCVILTLTACHDAPRKNPFDPELTPAVALTAALDDTAGTVTLNWTEYAGEQAFAQYWVLRNVAMSTEVDTLAVIDEVAQATFVDSRLAPDTAYEYRVAAVNVAGFSVSSEVRSVIGYSVEGVRLLGVERDPFAGTLTLRWSRYGDSGFASYRVLRREVGTDREELLVEKTAVEDTSYIDATALSGVDYAYGVTTVGSGEELPSNGMEARLELPVVREVEVEFESSTASASVAWAPYAGPHFARYRVERKTATLAAQVVRESEDRLDTSFVDVGLRGNTEYFYRVVVETERGEVLPGAEVNGSLHRWVDTWELPANTRFVRLYAEEKGGIAALISTTESTKYHRLLAFDDRGGVVTKTEIRDFRIASNLGRATALSPEGHRLFSGVVYPEDESNSQFLILRQEADGRLWNREYQLATEELPQPLGGDQARVSNQMVLWNGGKYVEIRLFSRDRVLFEEDYAGFPIGEIVEGAFEEWEFIGPWMFSGFGFLSSRGTDRNSFARRSLPEDERDFELEVEVYIGGDEWGGIGIHPAIQIGDETFSRFVLSLDTPAQEAVLSWFFSPAEGEDLEEREVHIRQPFPTVETVPYVMKLTMEDGRVHASVTDWIWSSGGNNEASLWTAMGMIGDTPVMTLSDQAYVVGKDGELTSLEPFEAGVSELRVWPERRGHGYQVGVCLPEENKLLIGTVIEGLEGQWREVFNKSVGPAVGPADFLFYPLSFDVGPDGRIFVLDSGNARIVVFDRLGKAVTQWGGFGNGPGEFNFGLGRQIPGGDLDFGGSVAVDEEGYIYVVDELNKRIQKFAP